MKLVSEKWMDEYDRTGEGWLRILSSSMSPLIRVGDRILVKRVPLSTIHVGDIVTYQDEDVLVTHRVVRKAEQDGNLCFIDRGDRYSHYSLVKPQSIIGKVSKVKKSKKTFALDAITWRLINRTAGILFNFVFFTKSLKNKLPFNPRPLKIRLTKIYQAFTFMIAKVLGIITARAKK